MDANLAGAFTAIVLAGGRSSRMGPGVNKVSLEVEGTPLVKSAIDAVRDAQQIVLVGPRTPLQQALGPLLDSDSRLHQTQENPPFGGPVAGILAGLGCLDAMSPPLVTVLACDVPGAPSAVNILLRTEAVKALAASDEQDGVCALAADGHLQWLLGVYRLEFLRKRASEVSGRDMSVRRFLAGARLRGVAVPEIFLQDLDTPSDVERYLRDSERSAREGGNNG